MNQSIIQFFRITDLFGRKDISIDFSNRSTILIGENGLGKTTILNILNLILKGDYEKLTKFQFSLISIKVKDCPFEFSREAVIEYATRLRNNAQDYGLHEFKALIDIMSRTDLNQLSVNSIQTVLSNNEKLRIALISGNNNVERDCFEFMTSLIGFVELKHIILSERINVIYLPTYRRIEADINRVMSELFTDGNMYDIPYYTPNTRDSRTERELHSILERNRLMKFGMKDIQRSINGFLEVITRESLRGFSNVSGNMISILIEDTKRNLDFKFDEQEMKIVLERIGNYLTQEEKKRIISLIATDRIKENYYLEYFLKSLLDVYNNQKKRDSALKQFAMVCNLFLYDKMFYYDESHISFNMYYNGDKNRSEPISLEKLSSGEKQIVSLFAAVYLELKDKIILLIDEPELSLSLNWQKKLLPALLEADACKQIVAVTHSPFVFTNELSNTALGSLDYVKYKK